MSAERTEEKVHGQTWELDDHPHAHLLASFPQVIGRHVVSAPKKRPSKAQLVDEVRAR